MWQYPSMSTCLASSTHSLQDENRALAEQISISTLGSHSNSWSESAASSINNSYRWKSRNQCCGSMTFWCGSVPLFNRSGTWILLFASVTFKFFCLLLFEATFTSFLKDKKSRRSHKTVVIKVPASPPPPTPSRPSTGHSLNRSPSPPWVGILLLNVPDPYIFGLLDLDPDQYLWPYLYHLAKIFKKPWFLQGTSWTHLHRHLR